MPSVSLAAEWVKVGGNKYNTAASDEAGTWAWDGADDMKLNGYNGGAIEAEGKLNVNYSGNNTVANDSGCGISVTKDTDGNDTDGNAELNIQGDASSTLNVTSSSDAIWSEGDINIDGAGTVNATSAEGDAIDAKGGLAIKGSGNVNATGESNGIRAHDDITIDNSGTIAAKATRNPGINAHNSLTVKGDGKVEASSIEAMRFGPTAISRFRAAARSRRTLRKTAPSFPRTSLRSRTPPLTQVVLNMASMPLGALHSITRP